jgi:undecaprenyl pyrophosphate synthase
VNGWVQSYDHAKQVIGKYMGEQGVLDKHARQEIAYAYYVLMQMTNQYQEYALKYDSRTEFQRYVRTIVDFQISRLVDEEDRLIAQQDPKDIGYIKDRTGQQ